MPDKVDKTKDQLDLLHSLPLDDSTEEKVEALWRQLMIYKSFASNDLSESKARRAEAEASREQAELETVRTTKGVCDRMRAEAERELEEARRASAEATEALQKAKYELSRASEVRADLDRERQKTVNDAETKAQEIIEQAQANAQQQATELRRQALKEIKTVLSRVEDMRSAFGEELETQRILTNVAKLKASSRWLWAEAEEPSEGEDGQEPEGTQVVTNGSNTDAPVAEELVAEEPVAEAVTAPTRKDSGGKKATGRSQSRA